MPAAAGSTTTPSAGSARSTTGPRGWSSTATTLGRVVGTIYRQPEVQWVLAGSSPGDYPDLDRFDRVTSSRWTKDLATDVDFYDVDIAYDRNSIITRVMDHVHEGFDWSYEMDDLDRLARAERGTWSGSAIRASRSTRPGLWTPYHQEITNAFRAEWGYGKGKPSEAQLRDIMQRVYERFP